MPKKMKVSPKLVIVCDDVRTEDNSKPFILGIYTGSINMPKVESVSIADALPALPICLWIPFSASGEGSAAIEFRLAGPDPKRILEVSADLTVDQYVPDEITAITLKGLPLVLSQNGNLEISFRHQGDAEWELLRTVPVTIAG